MSRKAPTLTEKLAAILPKHLCSWCSTPIGDGPVQWDHPEFYAFGSTKLDPLHEACHRQKTNGVPHVPLSGDISKIAKVKRVKDKYEIHRAKLLAKDDDHQEQVEHRSKYRWGKRKMHGGSKMPSSRPSKRSFRG